MRWGKIYKCGTLQIVSFACSSALVLLLLLVLLPPLVLLVEVGVHLHRLPHGAGHAVHLLAPQRPPRLFSLLSKKSESWKAESSSDIVSYGTARGLNPLEYDIFTKS